LITYKLNIARQPVYNKNLCVIGYELLFRRCLSKHANIADKESATAQVVLNYLLDIGVEKIVGERLAFINVTQEFIASDLIYTLDKEKLILVIFYQVYLG